MNMTSPASIVFTRLSQPPGWAAVGRPRASCAYARPSGCPGRPKAGRITAAARHMRATSRYMWPAHGLRPSCPQGQRAAARLMTGGRQPCAGVAAAVQDYSMHSACLREIAAWHVHRLGPEHSVCSRKQTRDFAFTRAGCLALRPDSLLTFVRKPCFVLRHEFCISRRLQDVGSSGRCGGSGGSRRRSW